MRIIPEAEAEFGKSLDANLTGPRLHYAPVSEAAYPLSKRGVRALARHRTKVFALRRSSLVSFSAGAIDTAMSRLELESSECVRAMIERSGRGPLGLGGRSSRCHGVSRSPTTAYIAGLEILMDGGQLAGIGPRSSR